MKPELNKVSFKKDGTVESKRIGLNYFASYNFFQVLINMSWIYFLVSIFVYFFLLSTIFAFIFYFAYQKTFDGLITNIPLLKSEFFHAVQTLTSGQSTVQNNYVNIVSSILSLIGILTFALITGLIYARFAKPTARILFSKNILVENQSNGVKKYSIRLVNAKISQLIDVRCKMGISMVENINGVKERKLYYVELINDSISFLNSSWTISHLANQYSPLYNLELNDLQERDVEFMFAIQALDDTYSTDIHTRISYDSFDVVNNYRFSPISYDIDGVVCTHINKVSKIEKI